MALCDQVRLNAETVIIIFITLAAHRMGFLAQKVEHQCTKVKVAGLSPAEVHFFSYPEKMLLYSDKPGQAGFGLPWALSSHYV